MRFHSILLPTDFSPASRRAAKIAGELAADHRSRLVVLHVVNTKVLDYDFEYDVATGELHHVIDELESKAARDLAKVLPGGVRKRLATRRRNRGTVEYRVVRGVPAEEILKVAEATKADLVVLSTRGRTGLARALFGSTAVAVIRNTDCPVLTIRATGTEEERAKPKARGPKRSRHRG